MGLGRAGTVVYSWAVYGGMEQFGLSPNVVCFSLLKFVFSLQSVKIFKWYHTKLSSMVLNLAEG